MRTSHQKYSQTLSRKKNELTNTIPTLLPRDEKSFRTVINLRFLDRRKSANWPPRIVQLEAAMNGREDRTPL